MERKRKTTKLMNKIHLSYSFYFFMLSIMFTNTSTASAIKCLDARCTIFFKSEIDLQQVNVETRQGMESQGKSKVSSVDWPRRFLVGPGSFPPRCNGKCGKCIPCKPVHVTVPPGTPVTAEYYPEAWRCKCGNKYYMP